MPVYLILLVFLLRPATSNVQLNLHTMLKHISQVYLFYLGSYQWSILKQRELKYVNLKTLTTELSTLKPIVFKTLNAT